jgi:hypothetical protein
MNRFLDSYGRYPNWFNRPTQEAETVEVKLDMLLEVFAPQIAEIRERRKEAHEVALLRHREQMEAYEAEENERQAKALVKRQMENERVATLVLEFEALPDLGGLGSGAPERLARYGGFSSIDEVREATDAQLFAINGIGIKTLRAIRQRIHEHEWNEFKTEEGRSGSYCDGCQARTGFVAC